MKSDIVRVSMSLTLEEFELLEERAAEEQRTPTSMAKLLVLQGLLPPPVEIVVVKGEDPKDELTTQESPDRPAS